MTKPLYELLKGDGPDINWTVESESSFDEAKLSLASAVLLHHPHPIAPLSLAVDASNTHIGAVLQQFVDNKFQPLSFFSCKLTNAKVKYSTFD